jgi:GNAT superfamily N-acetyltransferase
MDIRPATEDRWADLRAVLNPANSPYACWCLYWRLSSSEFSSPHTAREPRMRELVNREPAPGLLAYLDGEPVGWCSVGPRSDMQRLVRSRTIPAVDELPVWSVVCFVVRAGHRRQGVAEELLHAAVEYAREHGAPAIEGYPVDPGGRRINTAQAYVGTTGMFERTGFRRISRTAATSAKLPRWLMRSTLADGTSTGGAGDRWSAGHVGHRV